MKHSNMGRPSGIQSRNRALVKFQAIERQVGSDLFPCREKSFPFFFYGPLWRVSWTDRGLACLSEAHVCNAAFILRPDFEDIFLVIIYTF